MLLAVLSDIHGNLQALEAVLEALQVNPVDGFILAGDFVGGPQVDETFEQLRSLNPWIIKGNSDISLIKYDIGSAPEAWRSSKQFGLIRWAQQNISSSNLDYLKGLPEQVAVEIPGTVPIRVVHGSPRDPYESIFPDQAPEAFELALTQITETICIFGHTHIPWSRESHGKLALNPGAVCGPLNGDVRAQFALLAWDQLGWHVEHHAVPYDLARTRRAFEESGLLEEAGALAKAFLLSNETGQNVGDFFLKYAYRMASEAGYPDCQVVPDPIWDQATKTFDWSRYSK